MKKSKKIAIFVAVACLLIGSLMILAAAKTIGFHWEKLNNMYFETNTYEVSEEFYHIEINDVECDILLLPATDGICKVVCRESETIFHNVEVIDQTLKITRSDTRAWYARIGFWWGDNFSVTVYLPEQAYQTIFLKSVSGDIEVSDAVSLTDANLITTSGEILFLGKTDGNLSIKSTSGDISVSNMVGGSLSVSTTSGDLRLADITAEELSVSSTSGEITLSSVRISGLTTLKSVSGDIELKYSDSGSFYIKTTSGDVEGSILSAKNFVTKTTSGDVRVPGSDSLAGQCEIKTTSGDIEIRIKESN